MVQKKKIILHTALYAVFIASLAVFWTFIIKLDTQSHSAINSNPPEETIRITSGFQYYWGDSPIDSAGNFVLLDNNSPNQGWIDFQFPGRPENVDKYDAIWIKATLPKPEFENSCLRFRAPQQTVEVYLDSKLIYSYGSYDPSNKVRTPGSSWHFAELPSGYSGKTIYIRLHTPFPHYTGYLTEIAVGNKSAHYLDIFRGNIVDVIFGSLFILIGAAILLIKLSGSHKWSDIKYLGLTSIFMGGWYISESRIPLLFFNIPVSIIYAANFFIFLVPVWLLIYVEHAFAIKSAIQRRLLRIQWISHAILTFAAFSLDMSGLISSLYFDKVLHFMLLLTLGLIAYTIIRAAKNGIKGSLFFISGILALGITGLFDTFMMFYDTSPLLRTVRISYIGMLYFLLTLLINVGRQLKSLYESLETNSRENETNYKSLFTNMTEGFTYNKVEADTEGRIRSCTILESNDAFTENIGLEKKAVIGAEMFQLFPEIKALDLRLSEAYDETAAVRDLCALNDPLRLGDKWYKLSAFCPKKDHLSMIFSDITILKTAEETIRRQAYTDSMTGFFNRTYFEDVMRRMHGMLQQLKPLSIIAIDIDGLKITNDTFGHNSGDSLIKEAAGIISAVCKSSAIISRVGGDEFCIILPNTNYRAAQKKAEQIVKMTEDANLLSPIVPISMSIGVATSDKKDIGEDVDGKDEDIYNIYRRADDDMYRYKISQASSEKSKVIDMLLTALSERDFVSQGHVERLADLCLLMGDALKLHDTQKRNLVLLSKVHDLGKIGIPDEILNKPGRLTQKEYEKMKQHVRIGYNIANRSKELIIIAPLILHHHEHWDGNGYPDSQKGSGIPLECRILGIIDAFDAMTNNRPYHKGIPVQDALEEIRRCAGKQFDPELAMKFIEIVSKLETFS